MRRTGRTGGEIGCLDGRLSWELDVRIYSSKERDLYGERVRARWRKDFNKGHWATGP